mmetsp:Transcript_4687/g.14137  ORF Transcript_4687/g.14137 Transcript_4687/m.14137 type:complete len:323 (-) Transcript_4687:428-1396(-)
MHSHAKSRHRAIPTLVTHQCLAQSTQNASKHDSGTGGFPLITRPSTSTSVLPSAARMHIVRTVYAGNLNFTTVVCPVSIALTTWSWDTSTPSSTEKACITRPSSVSPRTSSWLTVPSILSRLAGYSAATPSTILSNMAFVISSRWSDSLDSRASAATAVATMALPTGKPLARQKSIVSLNPMKRTKRPGSDSITDRPAMLTVVPTPTDVTTGASRRTLAPWPWSLADIISAQTCTRSATIRSTAAGVSTCSNNRAASSANVPAPEFLEHTAHLGTPPCSNARSCPRNPDHFLKVPRPRNPVPQMSACSCRVSLANLGRNPNI